MNFLCLTQLSHWQLKKKSPKTFYLIKITKEYDTKDYDDTDDYVHTMKKGQKHLEGIFLERNSGSDKTYKLTTKRAFISKESIVYPFVQMKSTKKCFMLTDDELFQITQYVEHSGFTALFKA